MMTFGRSCVGWKNALRHWKQHPAQRRMTHTRNIAQRVELDLGDYVLRKRGHTTRGESRTIQDGQVQDRAVLVYRLGAGDDQSHRSGRGGVPRAARG